MVAAKIARWIIFGAIVSLLPLFIAWVTLALGSPSNPKLERVIGSGELLVIVWVLSASAIGELFGSGGDRSIAKIISGGATFIIIVFSTGLFTWIVEAKATNQELDERLLIPLSVMLFCFAFISSLGCLLCAGKD